MLEEKPFFNFWGHSKKYIRLKLPVFDPSPPCLFLFVLHVPPLSLPPPVPQRTFALVSYFPSQKKFCHAYDAYFEKKIGG